MHITHIHIYVYVYYTHTYIYIWQWLRIDFKKSNIVKTILFKKCNVFQTEHIKKNSGTTGDYFYKDDCFSPALQTSSYNASIPLSH